MGDDEMTKEQLEEILSNVWMRDWSAGDASDAIWGEPFDGYTQPIPDEPKSPNTKDQQPRTKEAATMSDTNEPSAASAG